MKRIISCMVLASVLTALAAPVWADSVCIVKETELRLRQSPSKKAKVVAVLKKNDQVTTVGECSAGWVKVVSTDGHRTGFVGGWALATAAPKVQAATEPAPVATPEPVRMISRLEPVIPVTATKEVPSNEKLAMQITELRLNVITIERDMDKMNKEIQKIKVSMKSKKGHKRSEKKLVAQGPR